MIDVVITAAIILAGMLAVVTATARTPALERGLIRASAAMHFAFGLAVRYSQGNIYGEGDLWQFREGSDPLILMLKQDFLRYAPQVLFVTLRLPNTLGVEEGNSTMSMITFTALGRFFLLDSLWALYSFLAFCSFLAKWGLYAALRDQLPDVRPKELIAATMLLPSLVFWSSGLVKEAFAVMGVGALFYGLHAGAGRPKALAYAVLGAVLVGVFKPYLLFPFTIGAAAWLALRRSKRAFETKPVYLLLGIALGYGLVVALGSLFPAFAPDHFAEQAAEAQLYGEKAGGGSYYRMGDANVRTLSGQLAYAPLALLTTLARPALFEAHNGTSFLAALEMTVLTAYLVRALFLGGATALRNILKSPVMVFCTLFVAFAGAAIGLATTNFGTLSRYRVPVLPFYGAFVVGLAAEARRIRAATSRSAAGARRTLGARASREPPRPVKRAASRA